MRSATEQEYVMTGYQVGFIVGSLSKESINRLLAQALMWMRCCS